MQSRETGQRRLLCARCAGVSCAQNNCRHLRKTPAGLSALKLKRNSVFRELFSLIQILSPLRVPADSFPRCVGPNTLCADLVQSKEGCE